MKKLLSFLLVFILIISAVPLGAFTFTASAETDGYYNYTVSNGEAQITYVSESISGDVTIPSNLGGYPVTSIGIHVFSRCDSLTSITIPDSVTNIGDYAFRGCTSLTSVTIPDSVTSIGYYAFNGCTSLTGVYITDIAAWCNIDFDSYYSNPLYYAKNLYLNGELVTELVIPDSVTSIGECAFSNCTNLTSVTIPDSVTSIGDYAFSNCTNLTSIAIPDSVTSIGNSAFSNCTNLTSVTIGDSVTSIGDNAFYYCRSLTSVTILGSVTSIGDYAFYYCRSLTSVTIPGSVTSIGDYAFYYCKSLTSVTIPDSVTSIGDSAFDNTGYYNDNSNWENDVLYIGKHLIKAKGSISGHYTIKSGTLTIGGSAFYGCKNLTSVTIPGSVTSLGDYAFRGCTGLTSITIPDSVTSLGDYAFEDCTNLTSITIPTSIKSIGYGAFRGCTGLKDVYYGGSWAQHADISIDGDNTELEDATWYYSDSEILKYSFDYDNLTATVIDCAPFVTIANIKKTVEKDGKTYTVTSISNSAFRDCTGLISVTIPDSVTSIGERAFYNCKNLISITIPDSVTSIGDSAFYGCTGLKDVYYGGSWAQHTDISIGWDNTELKDATWYYSDSEILKYSFDYDNLTATVIDCAPFVTIANIKKTVEKDGKTYTVTSIGNDAFYNCTSLTNITIPDSVTSLGDYAFSNCTGLTSVTIPDSVTSIGYSAFYYCTSLTSVTIPDSVTSIGYRAFYGCTSLTSITIPDSVTSIGYRAFYGCTSLTSITIPDSVTSIGDYAFYGCTSLTSITIPDSVTSLGDYAFYGCRSLTSVTIPDSVTSIGDYAFRGCTGLTSMKIPTSVKSIGYGAFMGCTGLKDVYYGGSWVQHTDISIYSGNTELKDATWYYSDSEILKYSFDYDNLTATVIDCAPFVTMANIPQAVEKDGKTYTVTSIGDYAFEYCTNLTSITIPDSVTSIGYRAFYNCTSLTRVTIPDSVTSIGNDAFYGCTALTSIIVSDGNKNYSSINGVLFNKNITTLLKYPIGKTDTTYIIPDSVTSIGGYAFEDCTNITSVTIPDSVTSISNYAFYGCTALTSIIVSDGNKNYSSINGVLFNKNITTLLKYPIGKTDTTYIIPDSVTSIGNDAFYNCTNLTSVTIPDSVTSIGYSAFRDCTGLTSVTIPDSVTSIDDYAFEDCTNITSITILGSVTSIGDYAFRNCTGLTSITIPDSVTSIGGYAFYGCTSLKDVYCLGSEEDVAQITISYGNEQLTNATWYYNSCINVHTHTYDNVCDTSCNVCGFLITPIHLYNNVCDSDCNICGEFREAPHEGDFMCDLCGIAIKFTITWRDYDGTILGTTYCGRGKTPIFEGETPTREGNSQYSYTFAGWQSEIKAAYADAEYIAEYNKTALTSYIITFDANGGSNPPVSKAKTPGKAINLSNSTPTLSGHKFLGWKCAQSDTIYQGGDAFNIDGNLTLYAVWGKTCSSCDGKGGRNTYSTCTTCKGTGEGSTQKCGFCSGTGRKCGNCGGIATTIIQGLGQVCSSCGSTSRRNCASCNGAGTWTNDYCTTCGGDGTTSSYSSCYSCSGKGYLASGNSTVSLYLDSSLLGTETVYINHPYQLTVPSKTGYTFVGWFDSYNGGTQYTDSEGICLATWSEKADKSLFAQWKPNYYTITYDCPQDVNIDNMPLIYTVEDADFILNSQSPREHYNFYWRISGQNVNSFDTSIAKNIVVVGVWVPVNYSITYDLDGGTSTNKTSYNIKTGKFNLVAPKKTGYTFVGWTGSNGNVPEKNVTISSSQPKNLSFTANWTLSIYNITYELYGGVNALKNPAAFTMIDNIALKPAEKDYYMFEGWYLDSAFTKKITNINGYSNNLTLYARFIPYSYNATFDSKEGYFSYDVTLVWGGNLQNEILSYKSGDIFYPYEVDVPSRSGYLFNGWYLDSSFSTPLPETYTVSADTKLYAQWFKKVESTAKELTLGDYEYIWSSYDQSHDYYFYVSPEHSGEANVNYYLYGCKIDGGVKSSQFKIVDVTTGTTLVSRVLGQNWSSSGNASITLVAGHTYRLYTYTITNNSISGKVEIILSIGQNTFPQKFVISSLATAEEKYGEPTQYPIPLREDYDFVGWYDEDGNPIQYNWGYPSDETFYPQWKLHEFTVNYNLNGGLNSDLNPLSYTISDSVITLLDPSKEGYTFLGWYTDPNFRNQITEINCEDRVDYTLYAKWISDFFGVNYELNGGINNPSNIQLIGRTEEFTLIDPSREGYTFVGWYLESYYSTKVTTLYGSEHRDHKVYAKWTPSSYTATLDYSGGQNCPTIEFVSQGSVIKTVDLYKGKTFNYFVPQAPDDNLKFAGWCTDSSCTNLFNFNGIIDYDLTVYAKWVSVNTNYEYATLGGSYHVSISGITNQYLAIMSPISQTVTVSSDSGLDLFGAIYDSNMKLLYSCDDISNDNLDFSMTFTMEAGKVYYIAYKANQALVSGNGTINITGVQNPNTFITGDYTEIIESIDVKYLSYFALPVPKREGYIFVGWFDENDTKIIDGTWTFATNKTLTAKWVECYTVIFKDLAGNIISTETYFLGENIVAPELPTKAPDETYIYHAKWNNDYTGVCTGNAVYFPIFDEEYIEYNIVFVDKDGTEISRTTYHWGDAVIPPGMPITAVDDTYAYIYNFVGWDNDVVNCAGAATYTATYSSAPFKEMVLISQPDKVRYRTGESIDLNGLVLQCFYANDTHVFLNSVNTQFITADLSTPGKKVVAITILGESVEFEIYVHDAEEILIDIDSSLYPQSAHDYSNNLDETKTFTYSGAKYLVVTFNSRTSLESYCDYIYIYDGAGNQLAKYTGTTAANKTLIITGDTFKIRLISDYWNVNYGYAFSSIQANMGNIGEIIHNPVIDPSTATCAQGGLSEGSHCDICGDILVAQEKIGATGIHIYDDDFDATCNNCDFVREAKKHGDANDDRFLNNRDLANIMQYINGWAVDIYLDAADVNDDGKINNKDYVLIMRYINGWDVVLK